MSNEKNTPHTNHTEKHMLQYNKHHTNWGIQSVHPSFSTVFIADQYWKEDKLSAKMRRVYRHDLLQFIFQQII